MQDRGLLMRGETNRPSEGRRESRPKPPGRNCAHGSPDLTRLGTPWDSINGESKGHVFIASSLLPYPPECGFHVGHFKARSKSSKASIHEKATLERMARGDRSAGRRRTHGPVLGDAIPLIVNKTGFLQLR